MMVDLVTIFENAKRRKQKLNLSYAGALRPREAYAILLNDPDSVLVDVRTSAEWDWVGVPNLPPERYVQIEWNQYLTGERNPNFLNDLQKKVPKHKMVFFLCRSGGRSNSAAIAAQDQGYGQAYNILEGFEGDKDEQGQRNQNGGWRFHQLPWSQS